ncbi:MAG: hypothetical protein A3H31_09685 [Gallionellales bacterium RIFCSPLOWO2_02_FULL_57_47]|nr:MAG: hypothetical protein A3H31_09685 [Gallionellales bacterium RIFCSPLOWO2_02_FULL_57_47]OGT18408.1 MAG: hypothetical protein A3J49_18765 [Gallionellales bacterium RIFCSPHIGHO2_02_FULL_57_16]
MKRNLLTVALIGAITFSLAAYAETPSLDEVVVTAARMPQSLDQTIAHTTVLNEQEIRKSGAPDVPTLLRSLAGVEVVQNGGLGKQSSTFMRGTNSSHVLVLLDGVRINSATAGFTALEHIMLDSIERIEVVRGNVSSLYGSEAIGGVIQLFTKRGRGEPALNASAGLGSHGTRRVAAGFSGSADATSFSVNAGKNKTDSVSAINASIVPTVNPDNDGYDNTTFNAQVQHAINADHRLSASWYSSRADSQYDNAFGSTTDRNNTLSNIDKLSLGLDDQLSAMWHSKLNWARGTDNSRDYLNDAENNRFKTTNNQLAWQNELQLADNQRVNLTAEHLVQSVASDTLYSLTSRSVNSLLGGYVGEYGTQHVQLNLRQDRYTDFGTANTGLLGYGLSFADNWRATASVSNAFKAPTFNDMYYPLTWGFAGNPNLRPEHARNNELGLHYAADGQRVDAVHFDNRIRDLIAINGTFSTMVNVNQARIDGWELGYAGEFGDTRVKASATLQNPRDTQSGAILLRRAKQHASVALTQHAGAWDATGEFQYSGSRQDADINTFAPVTLPGYQVFNLNARYQVDKNISAVARVDNLFDRDYMLVHGYNNPGRTLFVGLNYR